MCFLVSSWVQHACSHPTPLSGKSGYQYPLSSSMWMSHCSSRRLVFRQAPFREVVDRSWLRAVWLKPPQAGARPRRHPTSAHNPPAFACEDEREARSCEDWDGELSFASGACFMVCRRKPSNACETRGSCKSLRVAPESREPKDCHRWCRKELCVARRSAISRAVHPRASACAWGRGRDGFTRRKTRLLECSGRRFGHIHACRRN